MRITVSGTLVYHWRECKMVQTLWSSAVSQSLGVISPHLLFLSPPPSPFLRPLISVLLSAALSISVSRCASLCWSGHPWPLWLFPVWAVMNKAAKNICEQVFVRRSVFLFIAGSYNKCMFIRNCHLFSITVQHGILNRGPCALQQDLVYPF